MSLNVSETTAPAQDSAEKPLWQPDAQPRASSNLSRFRAVANARHGLNLTNYDELWQWSVDEPAAFWRLVWDWAGVVGEPGAITLADGDKMPGARWFPEARLNYAENLLAAAPLDAVVFWGEEKTRRRWTKNQLIDEVSRLQQALRAAGVGVGDRVAAYMPNMPETLAAMLATASVGATWSSCSPDFGVQGVVDRFGQIEPKVLFFPDGYWYNGKAFDVTAKAAEVMKDLPTVKAAVCVPYAGGGGDLSAVPRGVSYADFTAPYPAGPVVYERLPFDHPQFILYSSGTTGKPKCIVHGAGGTLLQHIKEHRLHCDLKPGDRFFYFSTCGWMMWNWLVTGLASGTTLLLYDGSPFVPGNNTILFDYADTEAMTLFGTSAKYIQTLEKSAVRPKDTHRLDAVRVITSTGSPLLPENFDYVYDAIKSDVHLASISGGTDIVSCFVLGNPEAPVWQGEIQARGLGLAVAAFSDDGKPMQGEKGELVCTKPFPSMPVAFWNDPDGERYRSAYFDRFPGIWTHGDFIEQTKNGGWVIYGRSDAVLNPGGVRIGTAEIYRQVEQLPEILESVCVGQDWDGDVRVVLFVTLREGVELDKTLEDKIRKRIRDNCSPRHVPARIVKVTDIPRTRSGKITELAVRDAVHGRPIKNTEALANPDALDQFKERGELAG